MAQDRPIVDLGLAEVKRGLADGSIVLIDVREPHEYAAGHIPGSVLHPLSSFDPAALPAAAGRRLVFSCGSGVRSAKAVELARTAGLDVSEHYKGGFKGWVAAGEPIA